MFDDTAHREKNFQNHIVAQLQKQGWQVGHTRDYDREHALYPQDIANWLQATQPDKWDKLQRLSAPEPMTAYMDRIARALEADGTVQVLRRGISIAGCGHIDLSGIAPEDKRNAEVQRRYAANILRVVPELEYHQSRNFAIDLAFFINGLPVATVEVKTDFTQSAAAAVEQYKTDRLPIDPKTRVKEPLLTFKRGAVVHFALSESDIQMTTKLDGDNTFFLPFNQGNDGHAGNPPRPDGYPVAYFWEDVCKPAAWLRIFHSFVYIDQKTVPGKRTKKETLIFPRFHQWSAVNAMIADAGKNGPGVQYLCEHSAGSGKTSTISWTAHDLIKLRRDNGDALFDSVIIVTDRTVLDSQLRDAVKQIDHQFGVIAAIDRQKSSKSKSEQLAEALSGATPIIVVTIQTFPYAMEAIVTDPALKERNFAVIIDEAHNSQTGATATKLQASLSLGAGGDIGKLSIEELLAKIQRARVLRNNVSHFAFTATPKHSTLTLFGRTPDGGPATKTNLPQPFHKYPMRQAIEEGFILDVMQGYTPYETAFRLAREAEDKERVGQRAARRALAQWMTLHPTNVTQKVQFIVEHFSRNVAPRLGGQAKAMVVTSSRAAAVRYKMGFDAYIASHPEHAGIRSLVAFSGSLTGKQVRHEDDTLTISDEETFTEQSMNPDIGGQDLRIAFDRSEYRVMLVADKFQTGFDQPKLVAMYIDKKIANDVEIVQTFSRLNRTAPGKDETFIIDFVNDPENVRRAFRKYDSGALIEKPQDLNVIYDIKRQLDERGLYGAEELTAFKLARFQTLRDLTVGVGAKERDPRHKALYATLEPVARRYNSVQKELQEAVTTWEAEYERAHRHRDKAVMQSAETQRNDYADQLKKHQDFKSGLSRFVRVYNYIAQLIDLDDIELEVFAAFAKLLGKLLDRVPESDVDLKGLMLTGYHIKERDDTGERATDVPAVPPLGPGGEGQAETPDYLKEIIERLNALFGNATPLRDQAIFVNQIVSIARANRDVMAQVETNSREQALKGNLPGAVENGVVRAMNSHQELAQRVLKPDRQAMVALVDLVYDLIHDGRTIELEGLGE
jgi:type I restriction enzyme R subunit